MIERSLQQAAGNALAEQFNVRVIIRMAVLAVVGTASCRDKLPERPSVPRQEAAPNQNPTVEP
jgi:hypothetical protein